MKKLLLVVVLVVVMAVPCFAGDFSSIIDKIPNLKEGIAIGLTSRDSNTYSLTQAELINWKDKICLNAGLATDFNGKNIEVASISYKIASLKDFGFNIPFEEFVNLEIGVWGGKDFINTGDNKSDWTGGIQCSIISKKF